MISRSSARPGPQPRLLRLPGWARSVSHLEGLPCDGAGPCHAVRVYDARQRPMLTVYIGPCQGAAAHVHARYAQRIAAELRAQLRASRHAC